MLVDQVIRRCCLCVVVSWLEKARVFCSGCIVSERLDKLLILRRTSLKLLQFVFLSKIGATLTVGSFIKKRILPFYIYANSQM